MINFVGHCLFICLLVLSNQAFSKQITGIEVPETKHVTQTLLTLNGAGVRSKFFMDLYVGSLYLKTPETIADKVITLDETRRC
ncbi:chalcone isomerase family protein [Thalassotalea eurytherma]|uniref:Chalcone isomerase domain-containing protein n=1 Tax=Thalassotalea eurytherma TaxID=1144278 RepID=A0ABQ6H3G6_9GAMM|nr:chalcone isomerase family protein [Thalassotalea eurytherma]GLX82710.1 hypothetical protein theurythT_21620 [Thalassotalea eurytherma]